MAFHVAARLISPHSLRPSCNRSSGAEHRSGFGSASLASPARYASLSGTADDPDERTDVAALRKSVSNGTWAQRVYQIVDLKSDATEPSLSPALAVVAGDYDMYSDTRG